LPRGYAGKSDRELVIEWLKNDLAYYKRNLGNISENNVLITEDLIDTVMVRIRTLMEKEYGSLDI